MAGGGPACRDVLLAQGVFAPMLALLPSDVPAGGPNKSTARALLIIMNSFFLFLILKM
jgi:hypothetical protein